MVFGGVVLGILVISRFCFKWFLFLKVILFYNLILGWFFYNDEEG